MSQVNLLPDDYISWRKQRRTSAICAVLFGVVMMGVLAGAVISERSHRHTREVRERVNQAYSDAEKLIQQVQNLEVTQQQMLQKAVLTAALQESVLRSYLLARVCEALPKGSSLMRFELDTKPVQTIVGPEAPKTRFAAAAAGRGARPKGLTSLDTTITLTGLAATDVEVARFIAAMARCELMDTVDLVYSQEKKMGESLVREFRVVMRLKGSAEITQLAKSAREDGKPVAMLGGRDGEAE